MSSLTRWVLAHKRTVVLGWILLTIAGVMAAAGPASEALEPEFSVPDKEGWETNVEIAKRYQGTGGDTVPLVPVVTLPEGKTVDSPGSGPTSSAGRPRPERGAARSRGSRRTPRPATARSSPTTGGPPSPTSTRSPTPTRCSARTRARKAASAALQGRRSAALPCT